MGEHEQAKYKQIENEHEYELDKYRQRQKRIYMNKVNHGFNVTDPYIEVGLLTGELSELIRGITRNDADNIREELADIVIYAYGLAEVTGVGDLDSEIFNKMKINENRVYRKNEQGDFKKIEEH